MKAIRIALWPVGTLTVLLLQAGMAVTPSIGGFGIAIAQEAGSKEGHADRADRLRRASRNRAAAGLGYETLPVPDEATVRRDAPYSLGALISRLGVIIQHMEGERAAAEQVLPALPGIPAGPPSSDPLRRAYGPEGPTAASVKAMLGYRLVTLGNPNLNAGAVTDAGDSVVATVMTKDGSLVATYRIDKKTGAWRMEEAGK